MDRRNFLKDTVAGAAALALSSSALSLSSCGNAGEGKKKSCCARSLNISFTDAPGETIAEKLDFMESLGVTGPEGDWLTGLTV